MKGNQSFLLDGRMWLHERIQPAPSDWRGKKAFIRAGLERQYLLPFPRCLIAPREGRQDGYGRVALESGSCPK